MVTFTVYQMNDALDHIKDYIANHMRKRTTIDLADAGDCRRYTLADLREAGRDNFDLVRLMWADERTPFEALKAFQNEKNRLDRCGEFSPLVAPLDGPNSKFGRLVDFFEQQLDAINLKEIVEAAE